MHVHCQKRHLSVDSIGRHWRCQSLIVFSVETTLHSLFTRSRRKRNSIPRMSLSLMKEPRLGCKWAVNGSVFWQNLDSVLLKCCYMLPIIFADQMFTNMRINYQIEICQTFLKFPPKFAGTSARACSRSRASTPSRSRRSRTRSLARRRCPY